MSETGCIVTTISAPPPGGAGESASGLAGLSRSEVAEFILAHRAVVRRRVLKRLRAAGALVDDADDVLASVLRRVDAAMLRGFVKANDEQELWAYVVAVADNVTIDRFRASVVRRARNLGEPSRSRAQIAESLRGLDRDDAARLLHRILMLARTDSDRDLILWKARGESYAVIAAATSRSPAALRTQWAKVCRGLRERTTLAEVAGWVALHER